MYMVNKSEIGETDEKSLIKSLIESNASLSKKFDILLELQIKDREERKEAQDKECKKECSRGTVIPGFEEMIKKYGRRDCEYKEYKLIKRDEGDQIIYTAANIRNDKDMADFRVVADIANDLLHVYFIYTPLRSTSVSAGDINDCGRIELHCSRTKDCVSTFFIKKGENPEILIRDAVNEINRIYGTMMNFALYL